MTDNAEDIVKSIIHELILTESNGTFSPSVQPVDVDLGVLFGGPAGGRSFRSDEATLQRMLALEAVSKMIIGKVIIENDIVLINQYTEDGKREKSLRSALNSVALIRSIADIPSDGDIVIYSTGEIEEKVNERLRSAGTVDQVKYLVDYLAAKVSSVIVLVRFLRDRMQSMVTRARLKQALESKQEREAVKGEKGVTSVELTEREITRVTRSAAEEVAGVTHAADIALERMRKISASMRNLRVAIEAYHGSLYVSSGARADFSDRQAEEIRKALQSTHPGAVGLYTQLLSAGGYTEKTQSVFQDPIIVRVISIFNRLLSDQGLSMARSDYGKGEVGTDEEKGRLGNRFMGTPEEAKEVIRMGQQAMRASSAANRAEQELKSMLNKATARDLEALSGRVASRERAMLRRQLSPLDPEALVISGGEVMSVADKIARDEREQEAASAVVTAGVEQERSVSAAASVVASLSRALERSAIALGSSGTLETAGARGESALDIGNYFGAAFSGFISPIASSLRGFTDVRSLSVIQTAGNVSPTAITRAALARKKAAQIVSSPPSLTGDVGAPFYDLLIARSSVATQEPDETRIAQEIEASGQMAGEDQVRVTKEIKSRLMGGSLSGLFPREGRKGEYESVKIADVASALKQMREKQSVIFGPAVNALARVFRDKVLKPLNEADNIDGIRKVSDAIGALGGRASELVGALLGGESVDVMQYLQGSALEPIRADDLQYVEGQAKAERVGRSSPSYAAAVEMGAGPEAEQEALAGSRLAAAELAHQRALASSEPPRDPIKTTGTVLTGLESDDDDDVPEIYEARLLEALRRALVRRASSGGARA